MKVVLTRCPRCKHMYQVELTDEEETRYYAYINGYGRIQDLLPNKSASEREQLKTGICPHCWEDIFEGDD